MNFIPLNILTGYTFLSSSIQINKLFKYAKAYDYKYLGINDFNVLYGLPEFNKIANENNIIPIFGMKLSIEDFNFSLYVENEEGYRNLCEISTILQNNSQISIKEITNKFAGLICVLSSVSSFFETPFDENFFDKLDKFSHQFSTFLIGLEIYNDLDNVHANKLRSELSKYRFIAFPLIKYLKSEDAPIIEVLEHIKNQTVLENEQLENYCGPFYFKNIDELKYYSEKEIGNTYEIFKDINFSLDIKRGKLLSFTSSSLSDSLALLKEKILEGIKLRNIDLNDKKYKDRLNYEFLTIKKLNYQDYFLIVQDYVLYAKNHSIPVGPGRGSAAGSLISYLLQITEIDPIKYNLLFERFLNPNRNTMPDIDVDFSDVHRDEIFKYIESKYGSDKTARIVAFQTLGAKQAIRDVGRVLGYPNSFILDLTKKIPSKFSNNSLKELYKNVPLFKQTIDETIDFQKVFKIANKIEGLPRQKGLHAAGIIIDNNILKREIPLTFLDTSLVTQYEKDYLEDQGFLKMDILGISNLTTIYRCLNLIKINKGIDVDLYKIDLNDKKLYDLISSGKTMGIFQLDTSAALNAIKEIKPSSFLELVATISLDRPGPMDQIPIYSRRKFKKEKITYIDKRLEPILSETYGIIVYQEQIMQIAKDLASFTFSEADIFRKAISKKNKETIETLKAKFINGAIKNGVSLKNANDIYDLILKFASYGFNKSHAVSYALIGIQQAYLKIYYPVEFYLLVLDQQYGSNDTKFNNYLSEIKRQNINILLPNINESNFYFSEYKNAILMPLTGIYQFPNNMVKEIIEERHKNGKFTSFLNFVQRMSKEESSITEIQIQKLIDAGCFDSLNSNRKSLKQSASFALDYSRAKNMGLIPDFYKEVECDDDPIERIVNEYQALGVMISDSLLNHVPKELTKSYEISTLNELKLNEKYSILITIKSIKTIIAKKGKYEGKPMAFITVCDNTDEIEAIMFPEIYNKFGAKIHENNIYLLIGSYSNRNNKISFIIDDLKTQKDLEGNKNEQDNNN